VSGKLLNLLTDLYFLIVSKLSRLITKYQITFQSRVVFHRAAYIGSVILLLFNDVIVDIFGFTVELFADDVNIYAIINDINDSVVLQEGLDALDAWSDLWQLPLSLQKCIILHLGRIKLSIAIQ